MDSQRLESLLASLATQLLTNNQQLVTAESCTGGWIAEAVTSMAGSSVWFERGVVTYSNEAKQELLGVKAATLSTYGAVSEQTAVEMATGILANSHGQLAIATTGIAGPGGGSEEKPVGTVWFGFAGEGLTTQAWRKTFTGDRTQVRQQAVIFALEQVLAIKKEV